MNMSEPLTAEDMYNGYCIARGDGAFHPYVDISRHSQAGWSNLAAMVNARMAMAADLAGTDGYCRGLIEATEMAVAKFAEMAGQPEPSPEAAGHLAMAKLVAAVATGVGHTGDHGHDQNGVMAVATDDDVAVTQP